jgi:hypothetical protein
MPLEGGVEPPTLWLTATRSNQLSYSSNGGCVCRESNPGPLLGRQLS